MYEMSLGMGLVTYCALPGLTLFCFAMWISLVWDRDPSLTECWTHSKFSVTSCGMHAAAVSLVVVTNHAMA